MTRKILASPARRRCCGRCLQRRTRAPSPARRTAARFAYPPAARIAQVDDYHGTRVEDPYRWLESPTMRRRASWIRRRTRSRSRISKASRARDDQEAADAVVELRALRHSGASAATAISICATTACRTRACCTSPTACDGAAARAARSEHAEQGCDDRARRDSCRAPTASMLAYSLSDGGTDWRTWHFRDVATGNDLPDVLRFIKFAPVALDGGFRGAVYYARYPLRADGSGDDTKQREVYWHKLGAAQTADRARVQGRSIIRPAIRIVQVSDDGRYLVIWLYDGSQSHRHLLPHARRGRRAAQRGRAAVRHLRCRLRLRRRDRRHVLRAHHRRMRRTRS